MTQKKLNVVVVICHDLGQHLGCYGASEVRSHHLDQFADSAIRFENAFCTAPQCSPSRAALWTGRYPHANGVVGLTHGGFGNELNAGERHLAQILREAGYETHAFGHLHEVREAERSGHEHLHGAGNCGTIAGDFAGVLKRRTDRARPFFAEICFFEPHRPFPHDGVERLNPAGLTVPRYLPDIPEVREDLADMEASIVSADRAFGRVLEAIETAGMTGDTLVVFTVDHGIAFTHAKMTLYDPGIEVALIMRVPGAAGGRVCREMVSNVDFLPTVLDLLDLETPAAVQGRSFSGLITGGGYEPRAAVFAEKTYHTYYDPMRAIRTERWKLIANFEFAPWQETSPDYNNNAKGYVETSKALSVPYAIQYHPPFELFDLVADPCEQTNLADDPAVADVRDELVRKLRGWMVETGDPLLEGPMAQGAYRERMNAFKSL